MLRCGYQSVKQYSERERGYTDRQNSEEQSDDKHKKLLSRNTSRHDHVKLLHRSLPHQPGHQQFILQFRSVQTLTAHTSCGTRSCNNVGGPAGSTEQKLHLQLTTELSKICKISCSGYQISLRIQLWKNKSTPANIFLELLAKLQTANSQQRLD